MHHIGSYLPHYIIILAYLDDLRDFPTKSLSLVFNFREAENLLFHVFIVSVTFWTSINRRKNTWSVFHREKHCGPKKHARRGLRPPSGKPTRPARGGTWSPLLGTSSVIWSPPFYRSLRLDKKPTPYFSPDLQRRRRRRKSSPTPGEGRSCCTGASGEGEIDTIVITTLPRRGKRHLHQHLHQHHHHHHHHLQDPPRSPHSLWLIEPRILF